MTYEDDRNKTIGARLQRLRVAAGATQGGVAAALSELGVPMAQQTIAKIENGTRPLKLVEAELLAGFLDVPLSELVPVDEVDDFVFDFRTALQDFESSLPRVADAIEAAGFWQTSVLAMWGNASGEARARALESMGADESAVVHLLTTPILELAKEAAARETTREP